ncbi:carbohydrate binding [Ascochyta rabiei]|uniref:Carbohydrate binding n=1 Tax=Didymella rabiei TaxID=5454 RepID=A0A163BVU1_DIDRA|nr:carbohydrate binding [Ascochyta rabiei]
MATAETIPKSTVQAQEQCYTRKDFVKAWSFPLQPLHDFKLNGEPAQYAPGYPKVPGDEKVTIDSEDAIESEHQEHLWESPTAAISPDKKLLAVTSNHERILVYDLESQQLRQVLDGAGDVLNPRRNLPIFVCSTPDKDSKSGLHNRLVFWELDHHGRLLDHEEPIDASAYAAQAIDAVLPDLARKHEWSREFVDATSLHKDFAKLLSVIDTAHRRRHNTIFNDARLGKFNSTSFSSDGGLFLYHTQNSVNVSSRESKDLPRIVVMDVRAGKELHRLSGHEDAICWSAISPDDDHIASVSLDGTLRMCSATTGDLEWVTHADGRSWTGAFSADSKHIV